MKRRNFLINKLTTAISLTLLVSFIGVVLFTTTFTENMCQITKNSASMLENPLSFDLTPHAAIDIDSDYDFITLGFPGSGTAEDPYVIEGYNITTTSHTGIYISGPTKYFTVRNCYVEAEGYGIYIGHVADGTATVINNTFSNNGEYGINIHYSDNILIHHNNFVDNNLGGSYRGFSQAYDRGGNKNTWYDPETKEGNYWSDLGDKCTYKIDGKAHSKDLYPLNRAQSCPNPITMTILSIVLPLLVIVAILAFVVPKYAVPYTKNTVIPNYRKRKAERHLRIAKMSEEDLQKRKRKRKRFIWIIVILGVISIGSAIVCIRFLFVVSPEDIVGWLIIAISGGIFLVSSLSMLIVTLVKVRKEKKVSKI